MNTFKIIFTFCISLLTCIAVAQESDFSLNNYWQIGIGFGEIPYKGSFKPSFTIGYHFNEKLYAGIIYQLADKINRNESSFNAKSNQLPGLVKSSEQVNQRLLLQGRFTPFKNGPYLSFGYVFNGEDRETMVYDNRTRIIDGESIDGTITITQTRPAGGGLALGLGYQYNFKNGFSANFEWTPAWFRGYAQPIYTFSGTTGLSEKAKSILSEKMDSGFTSSVTNLYKIFHIGIAYRIK